MSDGVTRQKCYRLMPYTLNIMLFLYIVLFLKALNGGSNMKKINNGGRLLIFYMMEGIKKVN